MLALWATGAPLPAQVRLADESDRAAFRAWFVLLADAQFERQTPDVIDCAALEDSLARLVKDGHISRADALARAGHPDEMDSLLR